MRTLVRSAIALLILSAACREPLAPDALSITHPRSNLDAASSGLAASGPAVLVYGPEQFVRTTAEPNSYSTTIEAATFAPPYTMTVINGDAATGDGAVTSATIVIAGVKVLGPSDFNPHVAQLQRTIDLPPTATLTVQLAGKPGSSLTIRIDGHRPALRVCANGAAAGTFPTLAAAVAAAPDGSTILLCDGTHDAENVSLGAKSLTIDAEGPGTPTLDAAGTPLALAIGASTGGASSSTLTIRHVRFVNASFADVVVRGSYGSIILDADEFHPAHGPTDPHTGLSFSSAVDARQATGTNLVVRNSAFMDGDIGILESVSSITITDNTFSNQSNAPINASTGQVDVERNSFQGCGLLTCIGLFNAATSRVVGNHLVADIARAPQAAISISGGVHTLDGNVVAGVGGNRVAGDQSTWPMLLAVGAFDGAQITVTHDTISDAFVGIAGANESGSASDNVVHDVNAPLGFDRTSLQVHRNDFTAFNTAFAFFNLSDQASATCNWWGSVTGPASVLTFIPAAIYSPFATQPIASRQGVTCGP